MPLQLRPAVPKDIPGMCRVYYSAFGDTIIGSRVFNANKQASDQFFLQSFAEDMANPTCQVLVVTHKTSPESKDEQVVALSKWNLPGAPIQDVPPAETWPAAGDLAVEFFGAMTEGHRRFIGDRLHYHLEVICVHEDWQGKGAASLLLRWGTERADAESLPCFLEATPKGAPIYQKYGFKRKADEVFEWPFGKSVETYMERDAKVEKRTMTRSRTKELA